MLRAAHSRDARRVSRDPRICHLPRRGRATDALEHVPGALGARGGDVHLQRARAVPGCVASRRRARRGGARRGVESNPRSTRPRVTDDFFRSVKIRFWLRQCNGPTSRPSPGRPAVVPVPVPADAERFHPQARTRSSRKAGSPSSAAASTSSTTCCFLSATSTSRARRFASNSTSPSTSCSSPSGSTSSFTGRSSPCR